MMRLRLLLGKVVVVVVVVIALPSLLVVSPPVASWTVVLVVHETEQVLNDLSQVRLTRQIVPLEATFEHGLVLFKVSLVQCLFSLDFSDLLNFIVVYEHYLIIKGLLVQALLGIGSAVRLLVADEGKGAAVFCLLEANVLYISKLAEKVVELSIAPVIWKVSNI